MSLRRDERSPSVKPDFWAGQDQRIIRKAIVELGVRNHPELSLMDRMRTKRDTPRSFLDVEANARFEPLALFVDERDERDGSFTNASRKVGEIVEFLFWGRVGTP